MISTGTVGATRVAADLDDFDRHGQHELVKIHNLPAILTTMDGHGAPQSSRSAARARARALAAHEPAACGLTVVA